MSIPDSSATGRSELQVRTLLGEIAQLAKREINPDEFHAEFLHRVVTALGAVGGGLWTLNGGSLSLAYQVNFKELRLQESDTEKHARLLARLLHSPDTGTLLPPHSGTEGENEAGNPSDHILIFCPIRTELEIVGLVEIIHRPDAPVDIQKSFVLFLAQTCHFATDYYKNRQLRHFGERQNLWTVLEDFTRTIHQSLDPKWTAYTVANEGRRLIGCDRVSVALRSGKACPIAAVSGQDTINKRATTVRLLGKLAGAVLNAEEPIWYTGSTTDFPPQIEQAIEKYVDESHCKMIAVYPLSHGKTEIKEDKPDKRPKKNRPFGVLIVEQIDDSQLTERTRKRMDIVAEHAGSALGNALEHHDILFLPLWKLLGKVKKLFTGETLPKTLGVLALVLVLIGMLLFLPWKFQMHCTGTLEPILKQRIYSPLDAKVKELFVDQNMPVHGPYEEDDIRYRGQKLVELSSPELEERWIQLHGKKLEILEKLDSLVRRLLIQDSNVSEYERYELVGQRDTAEIQLDTVNRELEVFERDRKPELLITSPMDGVVISGDLKRRLEKDKPLSRMQYVMEIADLEGPWQLELQMPEKRMGFIMEHLNRLPEGEPLRVEFVLAGKPAVKYYGTVSDIHDRAEVRSDSGVAAAGGASNMNTVAIKVKLDNQDSLPLELRRTGSECNARIDCGKRSLGYVLFYELIVYVQKNILFRWF